jgi:hypothetical protein
MKLAKYNTSKKRYQMFRCYKLSVKLLWKILCVEEKETRSQLVYVW